METILGICTFLVIAFLANRIRIYRKKLKELERENVILETSLNISQQIVRMSNVSGKLPKDLED